MKRTFSSAETIAKNTEDAYSFDAFGKVEWTKTADMLLARCYSLSECEMILRSKLTRWCRDMHNSHKGTADMLDDYLRKYPLAPGTVKKQLG